MKDSSKILLAKYILVLAGIVRATARTLTYLIVLGAAVFVGVVFAKIILHALTR